VLRHFGEPDALQVEDVPKPSPAADELLVAVSACGVCGHDLLARRGQLGTSLPMVLGHEISGVVERTGDAVSGFTVGDRVALVQREPCGSCEFCAVGAENLCRSGRGFYGEDRPGGYAEYVLASARNAVLVPEDLPPSAAAVLSCAVGTGWHALRRVGAAAGDVIVVTGAGGGVGVHALQLCRYLGARAIAVTSSLDKREMLLAHGADDVISLGPGQASLREQVRRLTGGALADVVLEIAGPPTFAQSLAALTPHGRLALIGNVDPQDVAVRPGLVILKELSVVGCAHGTRSDLEEVVGLAAAGHVVPLISDEVPLSEVARAHAPAVGAAVGRRVVIPTA
jgi:D-arabinose 1-dehydrogenase-like Zn-dependent alcohol dehydrogenase